MLRWIRVSVVFLSTMTVLGCTPAETTPDPSPPQAPADAPNPKAEKVGSPVASPPVKLKN